MDDAVLKVLLAVGGGAFAICMAVIGWFVKKLFFEIGISRQNERELYEKSSETRVALAGEEAKRVAVLAEMYKDQRDEARRKQNAHS